MSQYRLLDGRSRRAMQSQHSNRWKKQCLGTELNRRRRPFQVGSAVFSCCGPYSIRADAHAARTWAKGGYKKRTKGECLVRESHSCLQLEISRICVFLYVEVAKICKTRARHLCVPFASM